MEYTIDYFIAKFKAIPRKHWIIGMLNDDKGRHCALGHCGAVVTSNDTEESIALCGIFSSAGTIVVDINDDEYGDLRHLGRSSKTRVISALTLIKAGKAHLITEPQKEHTDGIHS